MIRILGTAFAALLGFAFGSFLNVCLTRWPAGESIIQPRSHCRNCNRTLAWWENIPLLSWLALRGRCRTCKTAISWRYPLVELAVCALWAFDAWQGFRQNPLTPGPLRFALQGIHHHPIVPIVVVVAQAVFAWCMVALAVFDAENLWLPNLLTIPGIILGFAFSIFGIYEASWRWEIISDCCFIPTFGKSLFLALTLATVLSILAAALLILLIRWLYKLIRHREGIGLGDAKLMAMLAAWLGLPGALLSFFIGVMLGSLAALVLLALPKPTQQEEPQSWALTKLPLGTFLCIGGIVSSLWGAPILAAYMRWAGF